MYYYTKFTVVYWLIAVGLAHDAPGKCDSFVDNLNTFTLNCSRRGIDDVTNEWPEDVYKVNPETRVLITFFENSIIKVSKMSHVPGSGVAISFKSNKVKEVEDDAFQNMPNIIYLDLSYNFLTSDDLRSEIFRGPYSNGTYGKISLETLNLGHNGIHSLDRHLFQHTPNLTRLYLNDNPINILDYVTILAISSAYHLKVLDLSFTGIDELPADALKSLKNLQQIDLSGNKFLNVPESLSLVGQSLEYLNFNKNPIVELNDDSFIELKNLKVLEVGDNENLEEVQRSTFSPLTSLRVLHLCHNKNLNYISHSAFRGLKDKWTIREVYLDDNNLSDLPTDLMPWNKVELLSMSGNNWLCNCDLGNIIIKQGAAEKFSPENVPVCAAPLNWSGQYVTNYTLESCPTYETTYAPKKSFNLNKIKPKHLLWSIFGVGTIVFIGMMTGLIVNKIKLCCKQTKRNEPIRYVNIKADMEFV